MPLIAHRPRLSDPLKPFRSKAVQASIICAVAVVALGYLWLYNRNGGAPKSNPVAATTPMPSPCNAPAQSFCATQSKFAAYIATGAFSDLLEQQVPMRGISNNLPVQTFEVFQAGTPAYLSRNAYIALLGQYAAAYGPFTFAGDTTSGNDIIMSFNGSHGSKTLTLKFHPSGTTWLFQSPSVD